MQRLLVSEDILDYVSLHGAIPKDVPRQGLELYLDAAHYDGSGPWVDSSGKVRLPRRADRTAPPCDTL